MAGDIIHRLLITAVILARTSAQDQVEEICYGAESVIVAVIVTLIVTLGLLAAVVFLYRNYWKSREGKHLMLVTDAENPNDQYAFDNPCFREATPIKHNVHDEKQTSRLENNKWLGWSPLNPFGKDQKTPKITSMDDSYMNDSRLKVVTLKGHDFTGLGFNICGNMRDGIFIKDVLHRGPAFESGCINAGDRIDSVCISFRNMVFEDALAILSYASPYDVQVQVENDSYSRPSTLIRSKRESNAISSTERILHPKYSRSQSITHLNEIKKSSNKRIPHHVECMLDKNRTNHSLNKTFESFNDYPTIKLKTSGTETKKESQQLEKNAALDQKKVFGEESTGRVSPNKHQKFGIKVLPINASPKSKDEHDPKTSKNQQKPSLVIENETNVKREKPETSPSGESLKRKQNLGADEVDGNKDNMKGILAKGFQNLKEKINQNTLGKKKGKDPGENDGSGKESEAKTVKDQVKDSKRETNIENLEEDHPKPKTRCSAKGGVKSDKENKSNVIIVPEEIVKAGDAAQNNRKSTADPNSYRKSLTRLSPDTDNENTWNSLKSTRKSESVSDSENSTDGELLKTSDEAKKPKRSKGKAPAPPGTEMAKDGRSSVSPKQSVTIISNEINEIEKDAETASVTTPLNEDKIDFKDLDARIPEQKVDTEKTAKDSYVTSYDSDSDVEPNNAEKPKLKPNNTKIELTSTQVTVHQSSSEDVNEDDIEPNRKAASLGDLSKLDSEQPLSIVLERAVSLDLADGGSQNSKKRKAPLPPSEEFSAIFDDLSYRKEPRLEQLGLNTFQRRLKKSSDFGTLEDALNEEPKSLEIEINKKDSPTDLAKTHNTNIQEFSTWLAECRRPKPDISETSPPKISSTSLVNINYSTESAKEEYHDYAKPMNGIENHVFDEVLHQTNGGQLSVNGQNFSQIQTISLEEQKKNGSGSTVVVISQPNSLEPGIVEAVPVNIVNDDEMPNHLPANDDDTNKETFLSIVNEEPDSITQEPFVTAAESKLESLKEGGIENIDLTPVPKSPVASSSSVLSSPPSSSLTYITEIKVSTAEQKNVETTPLTLKKPKTSVLILDSNGIKTSTPKPEAVNSITKRIQQFDVKPSSFKPFGSPVKNKSNFVLSEYKSGNSLKKELHANEPSKIPIKTMKSETGQKVLATIQSLATKETTPTKIPEVEYAKRVASIFSGNSLERKQTNLKRPTETQSTDRSGVTEFYIGKPETTSKPSKDLVSSRKIPPTVPPRKLETSLSTKSFVTIEANNGKSREATGSTVSNSGLPQNDKTATKESPERNLVTFSSFVPKNHNEEQNSTWISFKIK